LKIIQNCLAWFQRYNNNPRATVADAINLTFYGHGHQHIYMADELLAEAGFTMLRTMPPGAYGHEIFNGADGHGRVIGSDQRDGDFCRGSCQTAAGIVHAD
jgi:hypothetical protein